MKQVKLFTLAILLCGLAFSAFASDPVDQKPATSIQTASPSDVILVAIPSVQTEALTPLEASDLKAGESDYRKLVALKNAGIAEISKWRIRSERKHRKKTASVIDAIQISNFKNQNLVRSTYLMNRPKVLNC